MRIFVCSPLRGPDGQPSEKNKHLARLLMKAVFDAGHAPFVPHLLYPQVLSESKEDLGRAFAANFAFLNVCDEMWIYAADKTGCSAGMLAEVEWAENSNRYAGLTHNLVTLRFMPFPFETVRAHLEAEKAINEATGTCANCGREAALNRARHCIDCFTSGSIRE